MIETSSKTSIKRSLGYSKIKTDAFTDKKREILAKKDRFKPSAYRELDKQKLLPKDSQDSNNISIEIGSTGVLPPVWVDYYEDSLEKLKKLDQIVKDNAKLINSRIKMQFGDHSDLDRQIEQKTAQATNILHECEINFKRIQDRGGPNEAPSDKRIRENVERILATRIQEGTMMVRRQQKSLLNRIKDQNDVSGKVDVHLPSTEYSEELKQEMEGMDEIARERDEDINKLIDTINELSQLFKQMNQLVIEQGTLVDRIDYNVEKTLTHTQKAKVELHKAHKYQSSKCADYCIKVLIIMIAIFSVLLILKYKH